MITKTLTLIRHAKSSWSDPNLPDRQRPLNKRGIRDLAKMNHLLSHMHLQPDLVLCSTAKRTLETMEGLKSALAVDEDNLKFVEHLYEADASQLISEIILRPDAVEHLALIGHNPGLTDLLNQLCGIHFSNLATCAIAQMRFDCVHWSEITQQQGILQLLISPKAVDADS
ncbi:SixA phosphatase family protein [Hahella ganghwensis]|uniref:SixA phosphatase family protein n=1 Tax=Hahella ganghwensis TaxID=286420 RepID=UPI0003763111|nr:histidine phosphatase family protein [Hahella ganghwensis]